MSAGKAAAAVSRISRRGDGSVIGGVIGLRLHPGLLLSLARDRRVVLVTGTNGKTTTTRMIAAALSGRGQKIASNMFGANMEAGFVSALIDAPDASLAVLETDEKYVPAMVEAAAPKVVVLLIFNCLGLQCGRINYNANADQQVPHLDMAFLEMVFAPARGWESLQPPTSADAPGEPANTTSVTK